MNVLAPNPVTLTCTAKGEPSPDIIWIKEVNGDQMEYSESQDGLDIVTVLSTNMSSSTLTISPTDALDTANYSCMAENVIGSIDSQPAEVTVFGECIACILLSTCVVTNAAGSDTASAELTVICMLFFGVLYNTHTLHMIFTVQTMLFQLRLLGISDCVQWKVSILPLSRTFWINI